MIEIRYRKWSKDIGAASDLWNNLGFNLCVVPWSLVVRLVAYFRVREVTKTKVLRSLSQTSFGHISIKSSTIPTVSKPA